MKAPKSKSSNFEKHPEGAYAIVCTRIIDMGTVYNERKLKDEHKITFGFESTEKMTTGEHEGKPFMVFANFNFSMFQNSHLCKFIESWFGKSFPDQGVADSFDFKHCLGRGGFANIAWNEDFVNILSIMPLPKGMVAPIPVNELLIFDMETQDQEVFNKLSPNMQERLKKAKEFGQASSDEKPTNNGGIEDDVPFNRLGKEYCA